MHYRKAKIRKRNMPRSGGNPRQGGAKKRTSSVGTGGRLKFDLPGMKAKKHKPTGPIKFGSYLKKAIKKSKHIKYPF